MDLAAELTSLLGQEKVRAGEAITALHPGFHDNNLLAGLVAYPASTFDISRLLAFANSRGIGVVTHGGRTGLAGGAVSSPGQIILSLERFSGIEKVDAAAGLAIVQAGVVLEKLDDELAPVGLSLGIDLGARGSATIGGMISTNAGGIEAFRHGVMRSRVLGLEAVLADGTIMSDMAQVTKCNEGYDVKQLFIGAEGTLGVVTRAVLRLAPRPGARTTALITTASAADAIDLFNQLRTKGLIAFELMSGRYLQLAVQDHGLEQLRSLSSSAFAFLVEIDGHEGDVVDALASAVLQDAVLAKSDSERAALWKLREDSWCVDRAYPGGLWYDISVPLSALDPFLQGLEHKLSRIDASALMFAIGHLGDGNLHLTITGPHSLAERAEQVTFAVYDGLREMGGSISAEHGIGLEKRASLSKFGDPGKLAAMRRVKQAFDPNGIMNPGKVLELEGTKR